MLVRLGQEGVAGGWGNCLRYLKREQKRGKGKQRLLKGESKLGQGVGALKGGTGTPLRTMTNLLTAKCQTKKKTMLNDELRL